MQKLFVSFTGTLRAMSQGSVTESDLASGLFHFGCGRPHAIDPSGPYNEVKWFFKDDVQGLAAHTRLVEALLKAETEGRVLWMIDAKKEMECEDDWTNHDQGYRPLSNFLVRHGFVGISRHDDSCSTNSHYCYPGVQDRVKKAGLQLEVIH